MASSIEYRQRAEEQRLLASSAALPMVKLMHTAAADRWNCLAEAAELGEAGRKGAIDHGQDVFY